MMSKACLFPWLGSWLLVACSPFAGYQLASTTDSGTGSAARTSGKGPLRDASMPTNDAGRDASSTMPPAAAGGSMSQGRGGTGGETGHGAPDGGNGGVTRSAPDASGDARVGVGVGGNGSSGVSGSASGGANGGDSGADTGTGSSADAACTAARAAVAEAATCVETCADLDAIRNDLTRAYVLAADIDCSGSPALAPIGSLSQPFSGALLGAGHTLRGLSVTPAGQANTTDGVGLYGASSAARFVDLGLSITVAAPSSAGVGALVGRALQATQISGVRVEGSVTGGDLAGGIAGELVASTLLNSYASVTVTAGDGHAGLLIGGMSAGASLVDCYSSGQLPSTIGVLVSDRAASVISASFFDCDVAGCRADDPAGVPTLDLEVSQRFLYAGWDFTRVWGSPAHVADPTAYAPAAPLSPSYVQFALPCLRWESGCVKRPVPDTAFNGDGRTQDTPFQIRGCAQLQAIKQNLAARYALQTDVDCTGFDFGDGAGFSPIGSALEPFTGVLDGGGHRITGLRILRPRLDAAGLFGSAVGATIQNISVSRAVVMGGTSVGVLIGSAQRSQLLSCQVEGILGARHAGGGAIGQADATTKLENVTDQVVVSNFQ
jgi:hypothetical protein